SHGLCRQPTLEAAMTTVEATRDKKGRFTGSHTRSRGIGALAGAAAGGIAVGVLAMLGRKAIVQAPTALAGNWDEALKLEHAAVAKLFDALDATGEHDTAKRNILLMQLKHALMKHAIEEENVIYPALRDAGHTAEA